MTSVIDIGITEIILINPITELENIESIININIIPIIPIKIILAISIKVII